MDTAKPTKIVFEENYSDESGVQYAVRFDDSKTASSGCGGVIEFESVDKIEFPLDKIDWLIDALEYIRREGV